MRAMVSELLPAVNGTTSFRGRVGQVWADDSGGPTSVSVSKASANTRDERNIADLVRSRLFKQEKRHSPCVPGALQHDAFFCVMLQCRPGTVQMAVFVTIPGLQRTIRRKKAHAALRPGHVFGCIVSR